MMNANALAICWAPTLIGTASTQGRVSAEKIHGKVEGHNCRNFWFWISADTLIQGEGTLFVQEMIENAHHVFTDEKYATLDFDFKKRSQELVEKWESSKT